MNEQIVFDQIHIDVARNATDDFNLFHDKSSWRRVVRNPFGGPIVLGFQLESLIEHRIRLYRQARNELRLVKRENLRFSNYQFSFANAVRPGQRVEVGIKDSQFRRGSNATLSNRVVLKSDGKCALVGFKRESECPLVLPSPGLDVAGDLTHLPDRAYVPGSTYFLKRKFMTTSNAKNLLTASLVEQSDYFDELAGRIEFPEIFPCSLISCALLEKASKDGHDFEHDPMVYVSHRISVDRVFLGSLRSNDSLHILVRRADDEGTGGGLGSDGETDHTFHCYGVLDKEKILFRATIGLISLHQILNRPGTNSTREYDAESNG